MPKRTHLNRCKECNKILTLQEVRLEADLCHPCFGDVIIGVLEFLSKKREENDKSD